MAKMMSLVADSWRTPKAPKARTEHPAGIPGAPRGGQPGGRPNTSVAPNRSSTIEPGRSQFWGTSGVSLEAERRQEGFSPTLLQLAAVDQTVAAIACAWGMQNWPTVHPPIPRRQARSPDEIAKLTTRYARTAPGSKKVGNTSVCTKDRPDPPKLCK